LKNLEDLKKVLPVPANQTNIDKKQCEYLDAYDETSLNPNADGAKKRYDDEDDRRGGHGHGHGHAQSGPGGVQCPQQWVKYNNIF